LQWVGFPPIEKPQQMARKRFWRQHIADNKPLPCTASDIRRRSKMFLEQANCRVVASLELRDGTEVNFHVVLFVFVLFAFVWRSMVKVLSNANAHMTFFYYKV
jgi:hypothetical protein